MSRLISHANEVSSELFGDLAKGAGARKMDVAVLIPVTFTPGAAAVGAFAGGAAVTAAAFGAGVAGGFTVNDGR